MHDLFRKISSSNHEASKIKTTPIYIDLLEEGISPSTHKRIQKNHLSDSKTIKEIATEWYKKRYQFGQYKESRMVLGHLEKHLYPTLGKIPIKQTDPPMLFNIIEAIQENGTIETGKGANSYYSMIFRFAVAKGYCDRDMTNDYEGMLRTKAVKHMPALIDIDEIPLCQDSCRL